MRSAQYKNFFDIKSLKTLLFISIFMPEIKVRRIDEVRWEIPKGTLPCMRVPARIFATEKLLQKMQRDRTLLQAAGVACLPGIYKYSIVLPDGHEGYGFPIGGVAALDAEEGAISPGGIG